MGFCHIGMVKKTAFYFTGQGSQFVGMGKEKYDKIEKFKRIIDRAEEILEIPLKKLMFEGPEEILTQTKYAQPAILVIGIANFELFKEREEIEEACFTLGHSLGEFGALYASGVLNLEKVLRVVKIRGELMQKAGEKHKGTMGVAIPFDEKKIKEILEIIGDKRLVIANYNTKGQFVVSGPYDSVEKFIEISKKEGAKKAIMLKVSAAFHSPLMKEAALEFEKIIEGTEFCDAKIPVVQNVTAKAHVRKEEIKENIKKQILSPVRFIQSLEFLKNERVFEGIEFGPKPVLKGLAERADKRFKIKFFDGN